MLPAEYEITGKTVFVTGAGRVIGKGIARVLAEAGADVAIDALTPTYVTELAKEIADETGRQVIPIIGDVTKADSANAAVQEVLATFSKLDVLVNALGDSLKESLVGLPDGDRPGQPISDEDLKFILDINLSEALYCTRAAGPHMLERRSGKVINISSWTGIQGGGNLVLYTAAKAGLVGFTRAQALEWAPYGIQVSSIAPGLFPDIMTGGQERFDEMTARARQTVPVGPHGELREAGLLALYLASSASDYMTGQTLMLDGGLGL